MIIQQANRLAGRCRDCGLSATDADVVVNGETLCSACMFQILRFVGFVPRDRYEETRLERDALRERLDGVQASTKLVAQELADARPRLVEQEAEISDLRATSARQQREITGLHAELESSRDAADRMRAGRPTLDDIRAAIDGDGRDVPPAEREPVAEVA